jgi:hypothetical protein
MKTVAAALIILVCFPALTHAKNADAVVKIYATKGVRSGLGSGFFIRNDGRLVTAYHVVEGADHIEIFDHQRRRYDDVLVEFISPEYDIAVLRALDARAPVPFLRLVDNVPPPDEELKLFGYPRGSPRIELRGRVTANGFIKSTTLRQEDGSRLFDLKIDILRLVVESIYGGMSGGPVLGQDGRVVGILSGSWSVGGAIAWAIPAKYVRELTKLNQKPRQINWPGLALMAKGWKSLRKSYKVDTHLEAMLQKYWEHIDSLSAVYDDLPEASMKSIVAVQNLRYILSTAASNTSMATKKPSEILGLEYPYKAFMESVEKFDILVNIQPQLTLKSGQTYLNMYNWVKKGIQDKERAQLLDRGINYLNVRYASVPYANPCYAEKPPEEISAESARIGQLMDYAIRAENAKDFASRMINAIDAFEIHLANWIAPEVVNWMSEDITRWHSYGNLFEEVVFKPAN